MVIVMNVNVNGMYGVERFKRYPRLLVEVRRNVCRWYANRSKSQWNLAFVNPGLAYCNQMVCQDQLFLDIQRVILANNNAIDKEMIQCMIMSSL